MGKAGLHVPFSNRRSLRSGSRGDRLYEDNLNNLEHEAVVLEVGLVVIGDERRVRQEVGIAAARPCQLPVQDPVGGAVAREEADPPGNVVLPQRLLIQHLEVHVSTHRPLQSFIILAFHQVDVDRDMRPSAITITVCLHLKVHLVAAEMRVKWLAVPPVMFGSVRAEIGHHQLQWWQAPRRLQDSRVST